MYTECGEDAMDIVIDKHEEMKVEEIISFDTYQANRAVVDQIVPNAVDDQSTKEAPFKKKKKMCTYVKHTEDVKHLVIDYAPEHPRTPATRIAKKKIRREYTFCSTIDQGYLRPRR